ncbi:MAG: DUF5666 domain-containing protein [Emcibacteraceae bacterium]|nr:DUF5666 domain-containing protein [Emcibacteraceae bacterium]
MGSFSLNSRNGIALIGVFVLASLFALSRMPGGIGGTGISSAPGGIGGTGIFGRIDGFGSIWVNGVEVFYDEQQNVVRQGRDGLPDRLEIGQIVAVVINEETGRAEAQSIEIIEEVNGTVEELSEGEFIVLGQRVILSDQTIMDAELSNGKQISVSGFRQPNGSIVASYVAKPLMGGEISLRGAVSRIEEGRYWVGEQEVAILNGNVSVGQIIEVRGRLDIERPILIAEDYKARALPFDQKPEKVSYQGMLVQELNTSVIEFTPEIDDEVLVLPAVRMQDIKADFQNDFRRDIIEARIIENKRRVEEEARREVEAEARREVEIEARRQVEQEARKQAAIEATKQAEIEARHQTEVEARRQANIEARRLAEIESRRLAEVEARRQTAVETGRQAEIEARRQAEIETRRQTDLFEANRPTEIEARRQGQLEALRQAQLVARSAEEQEALRQMEGELRNKTDGELQDEIRRQVRAQSREEIQGAIREEMRRRIRRQIRQGIIQP